jgi:hypothetical protein
LQPHASYEDLPIVSLSLEKLVRDCADGLKAADSERLVAKSYRPGIGPFEEPNAVRSLPSFSPIAQGLWMGNPIDIVEGMNLHGEICD